MSEALHVPKELDREDRYAVLMPQWLTLIAGEPNRIANLANLAAAIYVGMEWHWVGFYLVDFRRDELVLGPFQGPISCTRLFHGKGVCASAWDCAEPVIVPDVSVFDGHVACSELTRSECVIPIVVEGQVVAVLDLDSAEERDFSNVDVACLHKLVTAIQNQWGTWE